MISGHKLHSVIHAIIRMTPVRFGARIPKCVDLQVIFSYFATSKLPFNLLKLNVLYAYFLWNFYGKSILDYDTSLKVKFLSKNKSLNKVNNEILYLFCAMLKYFIFILAGL